MNELYHYGVKKMPNSIPGFNEAFEKKNKQFIDMKPEQIGKIE